MRGAFDPSVSLDEKESLAAVTRFVLTGPNQKSRVTILIVSESARDEVRK